MPLPVSVSGNLDTDWVALAAQVFSSLVAAAIGIGAAFLAAHKTVHLERERRKHSFAAMFSIELANMVSFLEQAITAGAQNTYSDHPGLQERSSRCLCFLNSGDVIGDFDPDCAKLIFDAYTSFLCLESLPDHALKFDKKKISCALDSARNALKAIVAVKQALKY